MRNDIKPTDRVVFDLRMPQIDYSEQKLNELRAEIAEKYKLPIKNVELNFLPLIMNNDGKQVALTANIISSIQDPKFQQSLFGQYMEMRGIEDPDGSQLERILAIDNTINTFIDFDSYSRYQKYKVKYLKWSNYLSYGPDNYFDFTDLKGIVLLTGQPENQSGKTTFAIDLLRFGLYGKSDKSPALDDGFNKFLPECTEYFVETGLQIGDEDYVIRRTVTRPPLKKRTNKSKAKQTVEYFRLINGSYELIENCEAENTNATNNVIRESIGNVEDFNLVISATAYSLGELLRMGQTDKSKLFSRWLGLLTIEDKEKVAKDYYKNQVVVNHSNLDKVKVEKEISDFNQAIISDQQEIIKTQSYLNDINARIDEKNKEKMAVMTDRKEVRAELQHIDVVTLDNNIAAQMNDLEVKRGQMASMKEEYMQIKDVVYKPEILEANRNSALAIEKNNSEIKVQIHNHKQEIAKIQSLIDAGVCPTCAHPVDMVSKTQDIDDLNNKINKLIEKGVANRNELDKIKQEILKLEQERVDAERLTNLKLRMTALKSQIDNVKLQISNLNRTKTEIETNRDNLRFNNEIDNKIRVIDEALRADQSAKELHISTIARLNNEIATYSSEVKKREEWVTILDREEGIRRDWKIYLDLIGKNGIVKIVLKQALPVINNEVARLLRGLCDFDVTVSVSEDNKVCLELQRDGQTLDLGKASSGFEGTIASLALRCALANIASLARPNCLTLDEILSGISDANMENIFTLYRRVLENYDFILHICHDSTLMDSHDQIVTVTKKGNVSAIDYNKTNNVKP